jgi:hypothetical protein
MIVLGGVDGTSPEWDNDKYKQIFKYSHIRTLCDSWQDGPVNYERGPVTLDNKPDYLTRDLARRTFDFVMGHWKAGAKAVFLAGYSRGGAAVIEVAKWLKAENVPVECLLLLDPVDRSWNVGVGPGLGWRNTPVVDTVKQVIYAQRDYAAKSRESFGNCGTVLQNSQKTIKYYKTFFCTHGGVGGVPWLEPEIGFIDEGPPDFKTHVTVPMDILGSLSSRDWAFDLVFDALYDCKQRLSQPTNPVQPPVKTPAPGPGNGQRIHIVKPGDWLSKIAITYYGDMNKWPVIYDANRSVIGNNPDLILPGMRLVIP